MGKIILWGRGESSPYDTGKKAESIAILALSTDMCPSCGWALIRDGLFRGCPSCGAVYWKDFEEGLVLWEGEDGV